MDAGHSFSGQYSRYSEDARQLARLGMELRGAASGQPVRLSRDLAELALAAWRRDERELLPDIETNAQVQMRSEAATLALIGLAVEQGGVVDEAVVVGNLAQEFIADAIAAADRMP